MNKKGLAGGIIAFMLGLFFFAVISLVTISLWSEFNSTIQGADNSSIYPESKEKVDDLSAYILWSDKIFVLLFVIMLLAYIITSVTLPPDQPVFLVFFLFVLVLTTVLAMVLSNMWAVFIEDPFLSSAVDNLAFTDYFMRLLPIITFLVGLVGAILFYSRGGSSESIGGGDPRGFE